jgi:hypothetical protein
MSFSYFFLGCDASKKPPSRAYCDFSLGRLSSVDGCLNGKLAIGIKIPIASYAQKIRLSIGVGTTDGLSVRGGVRGFQKAKAQTRCAFSGSPYFGFANVTQQRLNLARCYARAVVLALVGREIFHRSRASIPSY